MTLVTGLEWAMYAISCIVKIDSFMIGYQKALLHSSYTGVANIGAKLLN